VATKLTATLDDCYNRALPDEPYFVLLARDPDAPEVVRHWATLREARIGRGEKPTDDSGVITDAYKCASDMVVWRSEATDPSVHTTPLWRQQEPAPQPFDDIPARSANVTGLSAEATSRFIENCGQDVCRSMVGDDADLSELDPSGYHLWEVAGGYAVYRRTAAFPQGDTHTAWLASLPVEGGMIHLTQVGPAKSPELEAAEELYASLTSEKRLRSPGAHARVSREIELAAKLLTALGGDPPRPEARTIGKHPSLAAPYGKAASDMVDVTDVPGLPPHRFTLFEKGKNWAYGRGLEINPSHIPTMLDRMQEDGYHLQAVFGGVEPTKVGMLFRRERRWTECLSCGIKLPDDGRTCAVCNGDMKT
jgi:hypothetical protein